MSRPEGWDYIRFCFVRYEYQPRKLRKKRGSLTLHHSTVQPSLLHPPSHHAWHGAMYPSLPLLIPQTRGFHCTNQKGDSRTSARCPYGEKTAEAWLAPGWHDAREEECRPFIGQLASPFFRSSSPSTPSSSAISAFKMMCFTRDTHQITLAV